MKALRVSAKACAPPSQQRCTPPPVVLLFEDFQYKRTSRIPLPRDGGCAAALPCRSGQAWGRRVVRRERSESQLSCSLLRFFLPAATAFVAGAAALVGVHIGSSSQADLPKRQRTVPGKVSAQQASASQETHQCDCMPLWECMQTRCGGANEVCSDCLVIIPPALSSWAHAHVRCWPCCVYSSPLAC